MPFRVGAQLGLRVPVPKLECVLLCGRPQHSIAWCWLALPTVPANESMSGVGGGGEGRGRNSADMLLILDLQKSVSALWTCCVVVCARVGKTISMWEFLFDLFELIVSV